MEWERYEIKMVENEHAYKFLSKGVKGEILKVVSFQHRKELAANLYNLAFGDWDEELGKANDRVVSSNGDRRKISTSYIIYGKIADEWKPFKPGVNFEGFLVLKKFE